MSTEAQGVVEASQLRFLEAASLRFARAGATLRLTVEAGECPCSWLSVSVVRAFPLSGPDGWYSVRDGGGKEVGILTSLDGLAPDSRRLVEEELGRRYLVPILTRIRSATERFGVVEWTAETDRGLRQFTTRDMRDNVLRPSPGRYVLTDVEENRYDVRDLSALDAASQGLLLHHL